MPEDVEVTVDGLAELADAMEALPPRYARAAARPALNAAGQVFEAALEATVPRLTGELAAAIAHKVRVSSDLNDMSVIVGPEYEGGKKFTSTDPGIRGMFLEFGTRKMAPRYWMRTAFESSKEAAYNAAVTVLKAIIEALPK